MRISCIYCDNETFEDREGSKEHVILSAFGGKKASRNMCCEKCNRRLGNEIDEPLTYGLRYFSNLCGIRTDRNKDAATVRQAGSHESKCFDLVAGGRMRRSKVHVSDPVVDEKNGKVSISISGRDKEEVKKLLSHQLKRFGKSFSEIGFVKAVETVQYADPITINIDVGLKTQRRSIAKTALTYLATLTAPDRIRSPAFKSVIEYINGKSEIDNFVFLTRFSFPKIKRISSIEHRVLICASRQFRKVVGFVELFGGIRFKVLLTEQWDGPDLCNSYIVDGSNGEQYEERLSLSAYDGNDLFCKYVHLPENEFRGMVSGVMAEVYECHVRGERKRIIGGIVEEFCNEYGGRDLTDDLAMKLSSRVAKAIANNYFRVNEVVNLDINDLEVT